jgi:hypothetical protein
MTTSRQTHILEKSLGPIEIEGGKRERGGGRKEREREKRKKEKKKKVGSLLLILGGSGFIPIR